jgi:hypothetical protein
MNVRFFTGSKADYLSLPSPRNPLGLYFCEDTKELFWADRLLTDGIRVVPTFADLPTRADAVAEGVVYYVTETRNGYVLSPDRTEWLQTIYAPATDAYKVPESEIYNTVTTVGAVRDIEAKIYKTIDERIANIEIGASGTGVKAIYFAGRKLDAHDDGTYHIDRLCALNALGFKVPEGHENAELELVTKEYVDELIAKIPGADIDLSQYYTKDEINELIPDTSNFVTKDEIPSIEGLASEVYVDEKVAAIKIPEVPVKVSELENDAGYITLADVPETNLSNYYNKTETENLIAEAVESIEHPTVDLSDYTTKDYVAATACQNKYEVLPIEGMFIQYRDGEIRLNTQRVVPAHQNVGTTGNTNMYYATFRAFAPEGATQCKEGLNGNIDAEYSTLATDEYGRKYTTIWAAIASYNGTSWSLFGANSNLDKYLGFYYHFEWYNEDTLIGTDKVRVILTNDACHDDLVPDAVARRIDDKIKAIDVPKTDLTGYATEEFVNTAINNIELPEAELYKVDFNAPDFAAALEAYNNGKLLLLVNAAPDANGYAVMNYVRDDMITFTKFLTSRSEAYGSFNTYYLHSDNTWEISKEVKLNKVEGNVNEEANFELKKIKIGNTVYYLPDTSSFATTKQFTILQEQLEKIDDTYVSEEYLEAYYVTNTALEEKNYITEQFVTNNYVTNETIEANYSTKEEIAETYVTNNEVNQKIENKVTEVIEQKMEDGNIVVNADSINYDTWDEEGW